MYLRVAIDLRRGGLEYFRLYPLGEPQHIDGAVNRGLCRLDRVELIVNWRGRAGEVKNLIDLNIQRETDIVPKDLEQRIGEIIDNVGPPARIEIVDTNDLMSLLHQSFTKMGTEKSGTTGYKNTPDLTGALHNTPFNPAC